MWAAGSSPGRLGEARFVDRFEEVNGVHPGFRRNHAKGVCIAGSFDSNGQGVRLSKAARVHARPRARHRPLLARRRPPPCRGRTDGRAGDGAAPPAACRPGVADGHDRHSGVPGQRRRGPLRAVARVAARSENGPARSGEDGGLHRRPSGIPARPCRSSRARRCRPAFPTPPSTASMPSASSTHRARRLRCDGRWLRANRSRRRHPSRARIRTRTTCSTT